ncbi:hypothetical protein K8T06_16435, partial [bacterium]|nr:hypothetical protein [bacterium]
MTHANDLINQEQIKLIFTKKQFSDCNTYQLGSWTLRLWAKQMVDYPNCVEDGNDGVIFSTGSPCYRNYGFRESLLAILNAVRTDTLDFSVLRGNFVLICYFQSKIRFLTDELNVGTVFIDPDKQRFSTSFLALMAASNEKWSLNKMAVKEKVATGYIVPPDTLVNGIVKSSNNIQAKMTTRELEFVKHPKRESRIEFRKNGFNAAVGEQLFYIQNHMNKLDAFTLEYAPELGLSSGYDSRLLLGLCKELSNQPGIHTHSTKGAHEKERQIAANLCSIEDKNLRIIPTRQMQDHTEQSFADILL